MLCGIGQEPAFPMDVCFQTAKDESCEKRRTGFLAEGYRTATDPRISVAS